MSRKRAQIVTNVERILESVKTKLPARDVTNARDLLEHDEWGLAFDLVCTQLHEYDVEITGTIYELIDETGNAMGLDAEAWEFLQELVRRGDE